MHPTPLAVLRSGLRKFAACLAFLGLAQFVSAQTWIEAYDKSHNFFSARDAFNKEWKGKEYERGKGYKQFKRWENFMERRVSPTGELPDPAAAWKARKEFLGKQNDAKKSLSPPPATWTPLGPFDWQNGNPTPPTPGNGRINVVVQDPVDANKIYIGASSGGLWRSANGGTTWTSLTDKQPVMGVSGIAIDPSDTNVIYIGTGDGDGSDTYSVGVLKSTDGGATWNTTGLSFNVPDLRSIRKLLLHPDNPGILFAATNIGVFKTTDAGATWTIVSAISAHDVEFHPTNPNIVYACTDEFYRSTDGGNTFTLITSGLPAAANINRFRIGVSPDEPDWVYVLGGKQSLNGFEGIYRSTDAGLNFFLRANAPNLFGAQNAGNDIGGLSQYAMALAVNPANADEIWTGSVNIWKSANGGSTFTLQTQWTLPNNVFGYVHADVHDIAMFGNNLYTGTDGGIFKSTNLGEDWTNLSAGLSITQMYDIGGSPTNANLLISGCQDNGTMIYSGSPDWGHRIGGDGITCIINPVNPNIMYSCTQTGTIYKSTNGGASFSVIFTTSFFPGEGSVFETVFTLDPNDPNTVYVGYKSIYKSTDAGLSWVSIGNPNGQNTAANFIAVAPSNSNVIYIVKGVNQIYKTTNGGSTWSNIGGNGLPMLPFADVQVDPFDANRLWVGVSGYTAGSKVFRSDNAGASWTNISANLPNLPVNCIAVQPNSNNILYVGMDVGIYTKDATQTNWTDYTDNLPNVIVNDIEINTGLNKLQVGTFGRGAWMADLPLPAYCQPVFTNACSSGHFTDGVALGSINNQNSGCGTNNYSDFTNLGTDMYAGGSYPITLTAGAGQGVWFAAMVDFNADKDFDDAGEFFPIGFANAGGTAAGNITVPATVFAGTTRLRILCRDGMTPIAQGEICGAIAFGEMEDYAVHFLKPACVNLSSPLNGATNVAVTADLAWTVAGNNVTGYRLDAGTTPGGSQILSNVDVGNMTSYNPANDLPYNSTIYVQIKPYNVNGTNWACPDESFQTVIIPPNCTNLTNPANGATNVSIFATVFWAASAGATGYRLNIGTTPGGTEILNNHDAGNVLSFNPFPDFPYNSQIYVKIIPYNNAGEATGCTEQSFTTQIAPPGCSELLNPLHLATNVPVTTALTWAAATGAPTGYRLRIGTSSGGGQILNNVDVGNVTTYDPPGDLPYNTLLYVGITPYNATGNATGCTQKLFTTAPVPAPTLLSLSATTIRIKYHAPINPATATAANLNIWGDETGLRTGAYSVAADTVTFVANTAFRAGELLHITSKSGLQFSAAGATMPFSWVRQSVVTHPTAAIFDTAGTGILLPAAAYPANASYQATMADMNRDGRQDLVYCYTASGGAATNVLVYLRNPNGSFAAPATYTNTESYFTLVGTPDLNNDGYPDLLMTHNVPSSVHVRLNNGAGGLGAAALFTVTSNCNGAKAYDMDRDGDLDIIAFSGSSTLASNTISVLKNNGNGALAAQVTTNTSVFGVTSQPADLDNDGDMDLAYTSNSTFGSSPVFRVYKNDGTGALSLNNSETNTLEKQVLSAFDYNGDGNADLITRNPNGEIYLGNAGINYTLATPTAFTASNALAFSADLDGDGDLDIFNANSHNGSGWNALPLKYFLNNGSGTFVPRTTALLLPLINTNDLSDYDSDGDLDHLYLDPATGEIRVLLNGNNMVALAPAAFLQGPYNAVAGNMNDQLRSAGLIPKTEPFTALGMALQSGVGSAVTDSAAVFADLGDNSIVDWIMVELRDEVDSSVLKSQPFLLQRDGDIVDLDGVSPVNFRGVPAGDYLVALRHRNHLGVMTAAPVALSAGATTLDFTLAGTPTHGANAQRVLSTGKMALWAGNANGNNNVKYNGSANDRNTILGLVGLSTPNQTVTGYFRADTNMDGQVKYNGSSNDRNVILSNVGLTTPNNVVGEQLPP